MTALERSDHSIRREGERGALQSIQAMRGFAATAVAIYHTHLILNQPEYGAIDVFRSWATKGWLGVNFFFVLSGFIILFAHQADLGRPARIGAYVRKRFARVYPVYWIALSLYLSLAVVHMGHSNFSWAFPNMASAYLLVPLTSNWSLPLQVAWTLVYEVHFYAMFVLLIANRFLGIAVFGVWIIAVLAANFAGGAVSTEGGMLHVWNLYFPIGAAGFIMFRRLPSWLGPWILGLGIAAVVPAAMFLAGERVDDAQWNPPALLALAVPFAVILVGATLCEKHYVWSAPNGLMALGAASYSIYLVHSPVISMLAFLNHRVGAQAPPVVLFCIVAAASVAAGIAFHYSVEQPVLDLVRTRFGKRNVVSGRAIGRALNSSLGHQAGGSKTLKVVFLVSHHPAGGAKEVLADIAEGVESMGGEAKLIALYPLEHASASEQQALKWTTIVNERPRSLGAFARLATRLMRILRAEAPNAVVSALPAGNIAAAIACRLVVPGARVILTHHTPVETYNPLLNFLDGIIGRWRNVTAIVSVSNAVSGSLESKSYEYRQKCHTIYNAVSPTFENILGQLAVERDAMKEPPRTIIAVGRFARQKNYPVLVRALAHMPDVRW